MSGTADPAQLVRDFLAALEARDLVAAAAFLHPEVEMIFPGGARFTRLEELIAWAAPRYRRIAKDVTRVDVADSVEGSVVVAQGTLYGEWPDGRHFDSIRFADWFLIVDGRIRRQHVWNDLAEAARASAG